jgi:Na+-transporting methylmalonyl-CoA/oxaloacetate decarboxylase gamma subunit
MDMSICIGGAALVVSVICLVMINNINGKLSAGAAKPAPAKAAAPKAAAPAAAAPKADNGAIVAAIAAALACMEGGEVASIRLAQKNVGWTAAAHIAGVQQF